MATVFILAGPNGAGKTTFYNTAVEEGFIDPELPFINVDNIVRYELGAYTEDNFFKAGEIARARISELIVSGSDFMIESNLATDRDYTWIESLKKAGNEIVLYFLCTNSVDENIRRVERRVSEGGHFIAPNIVEHRYRMGMVYLRSRFHLFKETFLIDSTSDTVEQVAKLTGEHIVNLNSALEWVTSLLQLVKLKNKNS